MRATARTAIKAATRAAVPAGRATGAVSATGCGLAEARWAPAAPEILAIGVPYDRRGSGRDQHGRGCCHRMRRRLALRSASARLLEPLVAPHCLLVGRPRCDGGRRMVEARLLKNPRAVRAMVAKSKRGRACCNARECRGDRHFSSASHNATMTTRKRALANNRRSVIQGSIRAVSVVRIGRMSLSRPIPD